VPQLLELYAEADAVVAARLHGVLLAHVAGTPALALSYERKVRTLMRGMGQDDFCLPIDDLRPEVGHERLRGLLAQRDDIAAAIRRRVEELRTEVESQYDRVFRGKNAS
jgi:polysaccharide pyruvyl transferase WcaK-like protein